MKTRKRHTWTNRELALLQKSVETSGTKSEAFEQVAGELGLTKQSVASMYYATFAKKPSKKSTPAQVGRPFDLSAYSETELKELAGAIRTEVIRRRDQLTDMLESM